MTEEGVIETVTEPTLLGLIDGQCEEAKQIFWDIYLPSIPEEVN